MAALILHEGKHFTPMGLRDWINKNLSHCLIDFTKNSVNTNDIHQYILMGRLPKHFGNYKIVPHYNAAIGFKYLELIKGKDEDDD